GQDPDGLYQRMSEHLTSQGWSVGRRRLPDGSNGYTTIDGTRQVVVNESLAPAAAAKTILHDLLTAPTARFRGLSGGLCEVATPVSLSVAAVWLRLCCSGRFDGASSDGSSMDEQVQMTPARDVTRLVVPRVGRVAMVEQSPGTVVLDATGQPVSEVGEFFASMLACGASTGSLRSYGLALLRWWRFLAAVEVPWQRAGRVEARDFVLWMRLVGPDTAGRAGSGGYAPATINHALAVVKAFYADRMSAGSGPLVNPVPAATGRAGRAVEAHHNPMAEFVPGRRAPLRQKMPERVPRSLPDQVFDALFAAMRCDRDRALLAFYVSTGARASELLGVTVDRVDPGEQRIGVYRKGSGRLQWLPASADAFVWLRLYEQHVDRPDGQQALWLTRRRPVRALTYAATRRMLQRANSSLATGWTLHDLRHTAAQRMVDDPGLSLTDVQWVLGHAHLTTTQLYLRPREAEVVARVLDHHRSRAERPARPQIAAGVGYRPEVLDVLLGGGRNE
ncbi:MAG: tyrosine-type recombinase/integrase, partial [Nocardioidaceae bacterium]